MCSSKGAKRAGERLRSFPLGLSRYESWMHLYSWVRVRSSWVKCNILYYTAPPSLLPSQLILIGFLLLKTNKPKKNKVTAPHALGTWEYSPGTKCIERSFTLNALASKNWKPSLGDGPASLLVGMEPGLQLEPELLIWEEDLTPGCQSTKKINANQKAPFPPLCWSHLNLSPADASPLLCAPQKLPFSCSYLAP